MLPSTPHHQLLLAFSVFSFLCPLSINNSAMREEGRLISVFTSPSAPPNPVSQSHPLLCSKPPATAPFSLCLNLQWITQIFPLEPPFHHSLLYPNPQFQHALPRKLQATPASEADRLTEDLHLFLCTSKSKPTVSSQMLSRYSAVASHHSLSPRE